MILKKKQNKSILHSYFENKEIHTTRQIWSWASTWRVGPRRQTWRWRIRQTIIRRVLEPRWETATILYPWAVFGQLFQKAAAFAGKSQYQVKSWVQLKVPTGRCMLKSSWYKKIQQNILPTCPDSLFFCFFYCVVPSSPLSWSFLQARF